MSNDKSPTSRAPAGRKGKATGTDTLVPLPTEVTKGLPDDPVWDDSVGTVGTTGVDASDRIRCGLPGNKGLKIEPVPGGLYRVRNLAGGIPPHGLGGLHTELTRLQEQVTLYNSKVK